MDIYSVLLSVATNLEYLAFFIGLISINKIWKTPSFPIIIYLGLLICVEYIGRQMRDDQWIYNLLGIVDLSVISYIIYNSVKEAISKGIIRITFACCILFFLIEMFFITGTIMKFLSYSYGFVSLAISIMCFLYLFELTRTEKIINQYRVFQYWLCIGLLVFHLCNMPITILNNKLEDIGNLDVMLSIPSILSIIMYSCFIIGFIWSKRKYNI